MQRDNKFFTRLGNAERWIKELHSKGQLHDSILILYAVGILVALIRTC